MELQQQVENSPAGRYSVGRRGHMVHLSQETEILIAANAARTGRTPDEIVRDALTPSGSVLPWRNSTKPLPTAMSKAALIAEMEAIAARSAARPTADPRSINEIIGYDDFGMPR
jgi:antitoxin VapB